MSAEYDAHAETESDDGGVSLAKGDSEETGMEIGSDTTPVSPESGESSSSANLWGEMTLMPVDESNEHGHTAAENAHVTTPFSEFLLDPIAPPFSEPHAAMGTLPTLFFTFGNEGSSTIDQVPYFHSYDGDVQDAWSDQPNGPLDHQLPPTNMDAVNPFPSHSWIEPSEIPQTSTEPLTTFTGNPTPTEHSEPPVSTAADNVAQETSQNILEDPPVIDGNGNTDGSDEDWLALSDFSSDIAHVNGTLHTLNQASNTSSHHVFEEEEEEEQTGYFSVSLFLYHWKQMYMDNRPDYPSISELANDRAKVRRPDKVTNEDGAQCDYQGIHWSRFQTTMQEAREVRRMTYRNLRNVGPTEQIFGTKAFKARFPGAVIPNSDCYFRFNEMDMKRRPDYSHFQLRHNLSATSKNAIFYTHRPSRPHADAWRLQYKTIACFNPETRTELCAMDVSKRRTKEDPKIGKIHTLTAGNGVLVAGSFEGLYAMKSLLADFESAPAYGVIAVGSDVSTNHIHTFLDRQSGSTRVAFDTNGRHVRILDATRNRWVANHSYPYQVNCSATSPDGRLRLLNGDDCEPIVANADTGETLTRLPGHEDFGFACDWAPDGITMATGHQDGLVKVWDARKLSQSIQTIAMEQAGCRSLQFSPLGSGKRVLVLAEPADFVHIVDAQTFESKQSIDFLGEISGISMPPDGSKLYIANADTKFGGLMEFERSWDSSKYNRRPFRVADLEDEHEEMVDSIVDGVQSTQRLPRTVGQFEEHLEPFMHRQGLPFVSSSMIDERTIESEHLLFECLSQGGGQRVTETGEWATFAERFGIPRDKAASFGQQLREYWQDNLAPYEASLPFAQMMPDWRQATGGDVSERGEAGDDNASFNPRTSPFFPLAEVDEYRRDYNDPRRKGFKIGRKSQSLDWLSESDMEDDERLVFPRGQRGVRVDEKDDGVLAI